MVRRHRSSSEDQDDDLKVVESRSYEGNDDEFDDEEGAHETIPLTPVTNHKDQSSTKESHFSSFSSPYWKRLMNTFRANKSMAFILQIGNIVAWYWTNGMNGIAMQSYAGQLQVEGAEHFVSGYLRFWSTLAMTSLVSCLQLFGGALLGRCLLRLWNPSITWRQIASTHSLPLSGLHSLGSLATNLGFMYGKASLVQVIKLLEPFETLLLSQMLFQEGKCSIGIFSAMTMVVGAAMSLLKLQSTPPHPLSIVFAVLSGLTLSCRNVLQRKHHHQHHQLGPDITQEWSKLEKSVVQFTQLSLFSGFWTALFAAISFLLVQPPLVPCSMGVLVWHPFYNVFSMITLGFCSALTHSLLNAGKRVFAICMAMLWFREGLDNPATLAGLALVGVGGSWYSLESKRTDTPTKPEYEKSMRTLLALCGLIWFQQQF